MRFPADDFRVLRGPVYRPKGRQARWLIISVPKMPPHRLQQLRRELAWLCRITGLNMNIVNMGRDYWVAYATMGRKAYYSAACHSPCRALRLLRRKLRTDFSV